MGRGLRKQRRLPRHKSLSGLLSNYSWNYNTIRDVICQYDDITSYNKFARYHNFVIRGETLWQTNA
jgi:hypothetical protein